jgi:hypothetical protein
LCNRSVSQENPNKWLRFQVLARMLHTVRVASHFCNLALVAHKPKPKGFPQQINTLGELIRIVRMERGVLIEDVAAEIGVTNQMICLWETHRSTPMVSKRPAIIEFLGFAPYERPASFG